MMLWFGKGTKRPNTSNRNIEAEANSRYLEELTSEEWESLRGTLHPSNIKNKKMESLKNRNKNLEIERAHKADPESALTFYLNSARSQQGLSHFLVESQNNNFDRTMRKDMKSK